MQDLFTSIDNYLAQEGHYAFRVRLDASHPVYRVGDDTPEGTRLSCTITNHGKTVLKLRGTVCEMP